MDAEDSKDNGDLYDVDSCSGAVHRICNRGALYSEIEVILDVDQKKSVKATAKREC
jgi:hypothetical protein